ncbi:MAG: hypothetical protein LBC35_05330 [Coriobacteriales bacterium]|jgi:hypothetical protein|nr:hypothetical protein [Coriobacteriales bacterium]
MLKIPTKMLILVAAVVWLVAGAGVVSVGIAATTTPWTAEVTTGFIAVYLLFLVMFLLIARKHIRRIRGYTTKLENIFNFFDAQSYAILAVMVGFGATVRLSGLVPDPIIAALYSGLGLALITSAVYYAVTYVAICDELNVP